MINSSPPPPFQDTRGSNFHRLPSEEVVNQWIRFGMPPVVVYSAYFANSRQSTDATSESLELAYKILQRASDDEKQCTGWEFTNKGARYMKIFAKKCSFDDATVGLLMDNETYSRLDELWIVLTRRHFPEPFDDRITAAGTEEKIRNMKQRFRGIPSFSTEPSSTSWLAPRSTPRSWMRWRKSTPDHLLTMTLS